MQLQESPKLLTTILQSSIGLLGFDTAVEEAQRAINATHVKAEGVKNGIGLIKLMALYSGYIPM